MLDGLEDIGLPSLPLPAEAFDNLALQAQTNAPPARTGTRGIIIGSEIAPKLRAHGSGHCSPRWSGGCIPSAACTRCRLSGGLRFSRYPVRTGGWSPMQYSLAASGMAASGTRAIDAASEVIMEGSRDVSNSLVLVET